MKKAVIIPAFNEEKRIEKTLKSLEQVKENIDYILVIDDGSCDKTSEIASKFDFVNVEKLEKNMGKGYVLNYGLQKILKENFEIISFVDADLMESAKEFVKLFEPIEKNIADVTIALFPRAKRKGGFGLVKGLAKNGIKLYTGEEIFSGISGQRAFKREVLESLKTIPSGYAVEVGMTIDILRKGFRIKEVPVNMTHNETGRNIQGFKHRGKQFFHILKILIQKGFQK